MSRQQHSREKKGQNDSIAKVQQYACHVPMVIYCVGLSEVIIQRSVGCIIWFNFGSIYRYVRSGQHILNFFPLKSTKLRNGTPRFDFTDCRQGKGKVK